MTLYNNFYLDSRTKMLYLLTQTTRIPLYKWSLICVIQNTVLNFFSVWQETYLELLPGKVALKNNFESFSNRNVSSAAVTMSPLKLDPLRELELLRRQQVQLQQLQQLQQLGKQLKQTSAPDVPEQSESTATKSSSAVVSTIKAESGTGDSWSSQYSHGTQSTPAQENNSTAADHDTGSRTFISLVIVDEVE